MLEKLHEFQLNGRGQVNYNDQHCSQATSDGFDQEAEQDSPVLADSLVA